MPHRTQHEWNPPEWLNDPVPSMARFHDEDVEVYEGTCDVSQIRLGRDNYRTLLDIDHLKQIMGNSETTDLTEGEIIKYIFEEGLHKIPDLAESIKANGVRVPLIVSYKKSLLDGNRRFLACLYLLQTEKEELPAFTVVPVKCTSPHISKEMKLKIISEMNFLPEHKEEWPREVRASFAVEQFKEILKELGDEEKAFKRVNYLLHVKKSDLKRFQAVLAMIHEYADFVEQEGKKARQEAERFGRRKFQFFEEFHNKALVGKDAIKEPDMVTEAKTLLYRYIRNQQLGSMMKVRDFAEMVRYEPSRNHLKKADGTFQIAHRLYYDHMLSKDVSTRVFEFCNWLENLSVKKRGQITPELRQRLLKAVQPLRD